MILLHTYLSTSYIHIDTYNTPNYLLTVAEHLFTLVQHNNFMSAVGVEDCNGDPFFIGVWKATNTFFAGGKANANTVYDFNMWNATTQLKLKTNEYKVTKIRRKTFNQYQHRNLHKLSEESVA